MNFPDLEELIPGLKEKREKKEAQMTANKAGVKSTTPALPQQGAGRMTPPLPSAPVGPPQIRRGQ